MPYALCPMPYALCPMPMSTSYESSKGYTSCTILRNGLSDLFHHARQSKSSLCHNRQGGCYYKTVFRVWAEYVALRYFDLGRYYAVDICWCLGFSGFGTYRNLVLG